MSELENAIRSIEKKVETIVCFKDQVEAIVDELELLKERVASCTPEQLDPLKLNMMNVLEKLAENLNGRFWCWITEQQLITLRIAIKRLDDARVVSRAWNGCAGIDIVEASAAARRILRDTSERE